MRLVGRTYLDFESRGSGKCTRYYGTGQNTHLNTDQKERENCWGTDLGLSAEEPAIGGWLILSRTLHSYGATKSRGRNCGG
jgi:hypothetical protein